MHAETSYESYYVRSVHRPSTPYTTTLAPRSKNLHNPRSKVQGPRSVPVLAWILVPSYSAHSWESLCVPVLETFCPLSTSSRQLSICLTVHEQSENSIFDMEKIELQKSYIKVLDSHGKSLFLSSSSSSSSQQNNKQHSKTIQPLSNSLLQKNFFSCFKQKTNNPLPTIQNAVQVHLRSPSLPRRCFRHQRHSGGKVRRSDGPEQAAGCRL
jgi:hypothetical protein